MGALSEVYILYRRFIEALYTLNSPPVVSSGRVAQLGMCFFDRKNDSVPLIFRWAGIINMKPIL